MGKERKGEGEREKGRSTNVERLIRVRANSMPLLEMFKRGKKRKEIQKEEREIEEMEAFRKSTKVEISPVKGLGGVGKI